MRKLFYLILITNSLNMFGIEKNLVHQDDFAKELSSYSFFTDQHAQIPSKRVFSYSLASSLFSDYTKKQRWVYVPEGYVASYKENEIYDFPDGSALIKTFYYDDDSINKKNLLETRLLIKNNGSWKAASYAWNEEQTEAYLKIAGKTINTNFIDQNGETKSVRYRVPNVNQCKECHALNDEISPIGPKARNMNKDVYYDNVEINQIEYFINNKIFKAHTLNEKLAVDWTDLSMSLDDRARSYLDINCGHCHIETGAANSTGLYLDLNEQRKNHLGIYKKPVATGRGSGGFKYSIVPGMPSQSILIHRMKSLDPGIMMPESGRALADKEAIEMLEEWIASL
jgi:uncharacterized repeat protein (TIGR03806 family)